MTDAMPKVYTFGMSDYAVINLKTDPELKKRATKVAGMLGISISAILNNELRRLVAEKSVTFEEIPEIPNQKTRRALAASRKAIDAGEYHRFTTNDEALAFLRKKVK